jgi:hypothetical protein
MSIASWELAAARRRGRARPPKALASHPASGVTLSDEDPSAEAPRERHPWRDAWTIVWTLRCLALHAIVWLGFAVIIVLLKQRVRDYCPQYVV